MTLNMYTNLNNYIKINVNYLLFHRIPNTFHYNISHFLFILMLKLYEHFVNALEDVELIQMFDYKTEMQDLF